MKTGYTLLKGILCIVGLLIFTVKPASAQEIDDVGIIISAGTNDASLLAREYLSPFANGFGSGLNAGWFNSAKSHNKFGFDIKITPSLVFVPGSDQTFDVRNLQSQFERLEWDNTSTPITPTLNGDENVATSRFVIRESGLEIGAFNMPEGSGFNFVPAPMIQASVGLIANTDLTLRYTPELNFDTFGRIKLFGVGVKHGINQWLPGGNLLPVNLAVQAGFTSLDIDGNLDVQPDGTADSDPFPASTWEGQEIVTSTNAFTANAIVSKDLPIISIFGGVGIESATMEIVAKGQYPIEVFDENNPGLTTIESIDGRDLIDFKIDSDNSVHALAGLKFKLAVFEISGSYTFATYPMAQASIGFSFR